jgi:hypothetical protein
MLSEAAYICRHQEALAEFGYVPIMAVCFRATVFFRPFLATAIRPADRVGETGRDPQFGSSFRGEAHMLPGFTQMQTPK